MDMFALKYAQLSKMDVNFPFLLSPTVSVQEEQQQTVPTPGEIWNIETFILKLTNYIIGDSQLISIIIQWARQISNEWFKVWNDMCKVSA